MKLNGEEWGESAQHLDFSLVGMEKREKDSCREQCPGRSLVERDE